MIDFGLSKHFEQTGEKHNLAVGTPYTIAPEIILGEYDEKVDVWALGVITYLLLCGETPFGGLDGESLMTVRQNIMDCNLVFEPKDIWDGISVEAKTFVRRLLTKDPDKRPSACEAQQDEWILKCDTMDVEKSKALSPKLVRNLVGFKDYSNLQKILLEVVSFTLQPEQIKELKLEFEKVDRDGDGEITLNELKEVLLHYNDDTSLGSLTDEEVEMIFDSLHLNTKEKTIKWHKFITAGLSQCDYDDRNLRLAFNRLDHTGKGYITLNDLNEMLRSNDGSMDEIILEMWREGMKTVRCKNKNRIYFADFQCFFKGGHACGQHHHDPSLHDSCSSPALLETKYSSHSKKRVSVTTERLLASTLALDVDITESSFADEDSFSDVIASVPPMSPPSFGRSSLRMPSGRRTSGCAVLIQSRDVGVFD